MRLFILAAVVAASAFATVAAPTATACHPALVHSVAVGPATVGAYYDHGCPHQPMPSVCVTVAVADVTTTCDLLP